MILRSAPRAPRSFDYCERATHPPPSPSSVPNHPPDPVSLLQQPQVPGVEQQVRVTRRAHVRPAERSVCACGRPVLRSQRPPPRHPSPLGPQVHPSPPTPCPSSRSRAEVILALEDVTSGVLYVLSYQVGDEYVARDNVGESTGDYAAGAAVVDKCGGGSLVYATTAHAAVHRSCKRRRSEDVGGMQLRELRDFLAAHGGELTVWLRWVAPVDDRHMGSDETTMAECKALASARYSALLLNSMRTSSLAVAAQQPAFLLLSLPREKWLALAVAARGANAAATVAALVKDYVASAMPVDGTLRALGLGPTPSDDAVVLMSSSWRPRRGGVRFVDRMPKDDVYGDVTVPAAGGDAGWPSFEVGVALFNGRAFVRIPGVKEVAVPPPRALGLADMARVLSTVLTTLARTLGEGMLGRVPEGVAAAGAGGVAAGAPAAELAAAVAAPGLPILRPPRRSTCSMATAMTTSRATPGARRTSSTRRSSCRPWRPICS